MEIRVSNVSKNYYSDGKKIEALADVDLTIPSNRIFTLLGPSGCGKTTLLRCIVGLETTDAGEIVIGDEVVFSAERGIFVPPDKRGLGMVFQTYAIWPHMNVFDNVAYPLQTRNEPKEEIRRKVEKTLHFVQLEGFDAGVSFRSVHDPRAELTHTVISNSSDGAWPLSRKLNDLLGTD
jgi:iron(III) transport system ATP-binding protein